MDKQALTRALSPRSFQYHASVDSTNDLATDWLKQGAEVGSVVIADEQLKGRGRKGRYWHTPAGVALALSVVLKPRPKNLARISMIGALAVYDLCTQLGINNVGIKYPNDVQINGKKVCGILPEATWQQQKLIGVVLGLGINVRVQFVPELRDIAINLEDTVGQSLDRVSLIATLLQRIDNWMALIDSDTLFNTWRERLSTLGQQVHVEGVEGVAQSVDDSGALLIKKADGSIQRVLAGDVILTQ